MAPAEGQGRTVIELGIVLGCTLALNWMWLMGFYNFLLRACFFSITLGLWWISREQMKLRHAVLMASLLVVIYLLPSGDSWSDVTRLNDSRVVHAQRRLVHTSPLDIRELPAAGPAGSLLSVVDEFGRHAPRKVDGWGQSIDS